MAGTRGPEGPHSDRRAPNADSLEALGRQIEAGGARPANEQSLLDLGNAVERKSGRGTDRRRRRRRTRRVLAITAVGVVLAILVVVGGGYYYAYAHYKSLQNGKFCGPNNIYCVAETGPAFNVLAIGSDSRAGLPPAIAAASGGASSGVEGQRSDVVKVFHVDPNAGTISVVSFPRDTMVTLLQNQNLYGRFNRLNVNYASGPALLIRTIEANFGIPINHVIQVGFGGLAGAVNALGGVWMHFPYPSLDHYSSLKITHTGCLKLDGYQALAVARSRHFEYFTNHVWNDDPTSDFGRIDRQNQFLRALINAAKGQYNPATINAFLSEIPKGVQIDSAFGFNELLGLAIKFHSFNPAELNAYTLPTYSAVNPSVGDVLYVSQPDAQKLLVKIFGAVGTVGGLTRVANPPPNSALQTPQPPFIPGPKPPRATTTTTTNPNATTRPTTPHPTTTTTQPLHTEPWYTYNPVACTPR